ncbi:MAG: PrgI family protein [Clostridia bacterium]|nr:PrgI family protein [Clostridia bacterium]
MATHYIPKDLKGETRILIIFSVKSLITTAAFGAVGLLFFIILHSMGATAIGIILLILFALLGYGFGTIKIPKITGLPFTKNIEGDSMDDALRRFLKYKSSRKVYSYTKEDK